MTSPSRTADDRHDLTLVVPRRHHGPPASGNGGWAAGRLAAWLPDAAAVSVRLSAPPPLDVELEVRPTAGGVEAWDGPTLVMAARALDAAAAQALPVVEPVDVDTARSVAGAYRGATDHPFPTCFGCGPDRAPGDGLRLTPGVLPDRPTDTACVWAPAAYVDLPTLWCALDCPGGWSVDVAGRPLVLGSITVVVHRRPRQGQECVVVGRALDADPSVGRTSRTAAALWADGELLATAAHVWVAVDPVAFSALRG